MKKQEPILWLRFSGEDLDVRSLPVYELGTVLIAFQRIINKAYQFEKQTLAKGTRLTRDERRQFALQIGVHKKSSDEYGLISFISDPSVLAVTTGLAVNGITALSKYVFKKVIPRKNETPPKNQIFINSIYNDVTAITNQIGSIGGIDSMNFRGGEGIEVEPISFTKETQEYIRELPYKPLLGKEQEIEGRVTKTFDYKLMVEIKVAPNYYTKILLSSENFDYVRYKTRRGDIIKFWGQPIYRLGQKDHKIREFQADSIKEIRSDEEEW